MIEKIIFLFPLWMIAFTFVAFFEPSLISWFKGNYITYALGIIMLGMGLTMKLDDFKLVLKKPKLILLGVTLQYTVMPASGYFLAKFFELPNPLAVGLILVSACPGGTASNVLSYIAKADVALSITLTTISTFLGIILTPLLTLILAGKYIQVNAVGLLLNTLQVILFPILLGVILNRFFPKLANRISSYSPILAILMIIFIVSSVLVTNKIKILESGFKLLVSVFLLHSIGFLLGFLISKLFTNDLKDLKTISIEVGMQNSGLGVLLAKNNFVDPLTSVPSAISSFFHSMIASFLAWIWRKN
jgi:bile acid:Na+ symporter, BASS family